MVQRRHDGPAGHPAGRAGAFYPGCAGLAQVDYRSTVPLLIQAGEADDWTPARYCESLAGRAGPGAVEIDVYPGAFHSFDRLDQPIRERPNVTNPNRPGGRGATVGTNPEARARTIARTTAWLEQQGR
jgi:dienelactone hydrolase